LNLPEIRLAAEVDVAAPPERVWHALCDVSRYVAWNPYMTSADGDIVEGGQLDVWLTPLQGPSMRVRPAVTVVEADHELAWRARVGPPGILAVEFHFEIEQTSVAVRLRQRGHFRGVMVPFVRNRMLTGHGPPFIRMNEALKQRAESAAGATAARDAAVRRLAAERWSPTPAA
jgi:hypothetical protein